MPRFTLFIGSDHAGFALKEHLRQKLEAELPTHFGEWKVVDVGTQKNQSGELESCDYPDFALEVAIRVATGTKDSQALGLLVCGSGIGMSIAANKVDHIRAAVVWDATSARLAREHNDANILCFGQRLIGEQVAWDALLCWMGARFLQGRHSGRIEKISKMEKH
jgi:ribose 5-phosphate isomerase B